VNVLTGAVTTFAHQYLTTARCKAESFSPSYIRSDGI